MKPLHPFAFLFVLMLAACGPSPELQATQTATALTATAAAWTPTSTPTRRPTATRLPTSTPMSESDMGRYTALDGSYSLIPPEGWQPRNVGTDYPALAGPEVGGYTVNLSFYFEQSTEPEGFYSAMMQDWLIGEIPELNAISEEFLVNGEGESYLRWEVEYSLEGQAFHQVYYFFEAGNWKLTVVYSRLQDQGAENDALVDAAIDTLQKGR